MDTYLIIFIYLILITLLYLANLPELNINDFVVELPKRTDEILIERKEILKRACKVAGELDQFATNGSSYDTLLRIHRRVHNLGEPLWSSKKACYAANSKSGLFNFLKYLKLFFSSLGRIFDIYEFQKTETTSQAVFCLPPKCGSTSWQRALTSHAFDHYR